MIGSHFLLVTVNDLLASFTALFYVYILTHMHALFMHYVIIVMLCIFL